MHLSKNFSSLLHAQRPGHSLTVNPGTNIILVILGWDWVMNSSYLANPTQFSPPPQVPLSQYIFHHGRHFVDFQLANSLHHKPSILSHATMNTTLYNLSSLDRFSMHCLICTKSGSFQLGFLLSFIFETFISMTMNAAAQLPASFDHPLLENQRIIAPLLSASGYRMQKMLGIDSKSGLERFQGSSGFRGWVDVLTVDHGWLVQVEIIVGTVSFTHPVRPWPLNLSLFSVQVLVNYRRFHWFLQSGRFLKTNKLFATCTGLTTSGQNLIESEFYFILHWWTWASLYINAVFWEYNTWAWPFFLYMWWLMTTCSFHKIINMDDNFCGRCRIVR